MYVADSSNNHVQKLSSSGQYLNKWTNAGIGQTSFSGPNGIALGASQTYVVDTGNNRAQAIEAVGYYYDQIGNITESNGVAYSYGSQPHAVAIVGSTGYVYDANGNMTNRGSQTIAWDAENRPISVTGGATFTYDGDGNRVKKVENSQTTIYVNRYYEKNLTTGVATSYYYLGGKLVALKEGSTTTILTDTGNPSGSARYHAYGLTMSSEGAIPTEKKFTGQPLDGTGLYYYNARYYDPTIGRFISADTIIPSYLDPQSLNRYSYVLNNPLKYVDPIGMAGVTWDFGAGEVWVDESMLGVEGFANQNPELAAALIGALLGDIFGDDNSGADGESGEDDSTSVWQRIWDLLTSVPRTYQAGVDSYYTWMEEPAFGQATAPYVDSLAAFVNDYGWAISYGMAIPMPGRGAGRIVAGFRNQASLDSPYLKHASEFGNITKAQYLQGARNLVNMQAGENILIKVRAGSDKVFYNKVTNELAVQASNGTIRTYFKPSEGINYFNSLK